MITVEAGRFTLGRDGAPAIKGRSLAIALDAFRIDRTETSNAAFADYLNARPIPVTQASDLRTISQKNVRQARFATLAKGPHDSNHYPVIALDDNQARIGHDTKRFRPTEDRADLAQMCIENA